MKQFLPKKLRNWSVNLMGMNKEVQAVMILKVEKDSFWYKNYVGDIVLVKEPVISVESIGEQFQIVGHPLKLVKKTDCEVLGKVRVEFDNDND